MLKEIYTAETLVPAPSPFEVEITIAKLKNYNSPGSDHTSNLVDDLHDIHNYARQHLKLASDWMETHYDRLANCAGYHLDDEVWFYH
jgi:hypothetical protein